MLLKKYINRLYFLNNKIYEVPEVSVHVENLKSYEDMISAIPGQ
jgi:hypothetical protein